MLTSIYQALASHLSRLRIPVCLADCVPEGTAFPYVTAKIDAPMTAGSAGSLTLTVWCKGSSAHTDRVSHTDSLYSLLPPRGAFLTTDTGALLLRQTSAAQCVQDSVALGMQSQWELHFYPSV